MRKFQGRAEAANLLSLMGLQHEGVSDLKATIGRMIN